MKSKKVIRPELHSDAFKKRLSEIYKEKKSFELTAQELEKEFGFSVNLQMVRNIYLDEVSKADLYEPEYFIQSFEMLKARWEDAWNIVGWFIDSTKNIKKQIDESQDINKDIKFLRLAPMLVPICREILNQLDFIRKQQEMIKLHQQNYIYSPIQINMQVHDELTRLQKEGYVKFLRKLPEIKIEKKEQKQENERT